MADGQLYWQYPGGIEGLFFRGSIADDGKTAVLSTYDYGAGISNIYLIKEGDLLSRLTIPGGNSFRAEAALTPDGSHLKVSRNDSVEIYELVGGE
jgi:hypothetical protein